MFLFLCLIFKLSNFLCPYLKGQNICLQGRPHTFLIHWCRLSIIIISFDCFFLWMLQRPSFTLHCPNVSIMQIYSHKFNYNFKLLTLTILIDHSIKSLLCYEFVIIFYMSYFDRWKISFFFNIIKSKINKLNK